MQLTHLNDREVARHVAEHFADTFTTADHAEKTAFSVEPSHGASGTLFHHRDSEGHDNRVAGDL